MIPNLRSEIRFLLKYNEASIYIKRDDMIPFSFGGNKVRIAAELFEDAKKKHCDMMISYGSRASNLNRVVVHMAGALGMKCIVICKDEDSDNTAGFAEAAAGKAMDSGPEGFNASMVKASGAEIVHCRRENVRETVERIFCEAESEGFRPYYVYGNSCGTGNEAVCARAYEKAFHEITEYEEEKGIGFDRIFTATGTGMTQAGLIAGSLRLSSDKKSLIQGISIARDRKKARDSVLSSLLACGFGKEVSDFINISDDYLFGGYGKYDEAVENTVLRLMNTYGIPSDPCYSGKAFYGMLKEIEKKELSGNILFIHTGGTAGFFDMLKRRETSERRQGFGEGRGE